MEFLAEYGYWGMFLSAFLAATILPLSSEIVLGLLLGQEFDPVPVVMAASFGNVLGAVVNYALGAVGSQLVLTRFLRMSETEITAAQQRFEKFGIASLLFAWVPVVGDPLTVAAGMVRVHFALFLLLVGFGKVVRYLLLAWAVMAV